MHELAGSPWRLWLQQTDARTGGRVLARRICAQLQEEHRIACRDRIGSGSEERSTVILKPCKDSEPALVPDAWLVVSVQTVDATPPSALIRQCFPERNDLFGCITSKPSQGSVPADRSLARDLAFVFHANRVLPECCADPLNAR